MRRRNSGSLRQPPCPVCHRKNALLCSTCANSFAYCEENARLVDLLQQRDVLREKIERQLDARAQHTQQQVALWQQQQKNAALQARADAAAAALATLQHQQAAAAEELAARQAQLSVLQTQLTRSSSEALGVELPRVIRYQELTLTHVRAQLAREQKLRLRQLQEIFPLRINAVGKDGPLQITICNLRLPDSLTPPHQGWADPQAVSTAVGYLLLLIDKVAMYCGGPLLHESHYEGSTSSLWVPSSFLNRSPVSPGAVLPLNVMHCSAGGGGSGGSSSSSVSPGTAGVGSSGGGGIEDSGSRAPHRNATFWGRPPPSGGSSSSSSHGYARYPSMPAAHSSGNPSAGLSPGGGYYTSSNSSSPQKLSRRCQEARAAWELLMRSLRCLYKDKALQRDLQLPPNWSPVAWLATYCAAIRRDWRSDGRLVATAAAANAAAVAAAGGGDPGVGAGGQQAQQQLAGWRTSPTAGRAAAAAGSGSIEDGEEEAQWPLTDEEEEEEEEEGWGMVQTPWLPPPPSQPEEVEHWARAMFMDANAAGSSSSSMAQLVGSPSGALLSMERMRSMFGR